MLPFCGYHMGDYFAHWINIGKKSDEKKLPKIFYVNWFRKKAEGKWLWPGYGENSRVLKWVFERCTGEGKAQETPIGPILLGRLQPRPLWAGHVGPTTSRNCSSVDIPGWLAELPSIREHFGKIRHASPEGPAGRMLTALESRLKAAP